MLSILLSLFFVSVSPAIVQAEPPVPESAGKLEIIIDELDLALDNFWELLDNQDLNTFVAGIRHAARARLLLEQHLGEDINNLSLGAAGANQEEYQLRLIARRTLELTGDVGRELWRQDFDDLQPALLRLSELDILVKSFKKSL